MHGHKFFPVVFLLVFTSLFALPMTSCQHSEREKIRQQAIAEAHARRPSPKQIIVGVVAHIDADYGFVLIRSNLTGQQLSRMASSGTPLEGRMEDKKVCSLVVSDQMLPPFVVADVTDGTPQVGTVVTTMPVVVEN